MSDDYKEKLGKAFEWLSAMQKCIRRSMKDDAGYWFFALAENGFASMALNRLKVIAHEDVGLADPFAAMFAAKAVDDAQAWLKAKNGGWRLAAANAIMMLADAKKGRMADNFQGACRGRYLTNPNRAVPDWALDKHTAQGKRMGRGFEHFFTEGTKLVDPDGTEPKKDEWADEFADYSVAGVLDEKKDNAAGQGKAGQQGRANRTDDLFSF